MLFATRARRSTSLRHHGAGHKANQQRRTGNLLQDDGNGFWRQTFRGRRDALLQDHRDRALLIRLRRRRNGGNRIRAHPWVDGSRRRGAGRRSDRSWGAPDAPAARCALADDAGSTRRRTRARRAGRHSVGIGGGDLPALRLRPRLDAGNDRHRARSRRVQETDGAGWAHQTRRRRPRRPRSFPRSTIACAPKPQG